MVPAVQVRFSFWFYACLAEHDLVKMLGMHGQRHTVYRGYVYALDDGVWIHIAELCYFAAHGCRYLLFGAEHKHVGLYANLLQQFYGVLRGLCLKFFCCAQIWHICEVYAQGVLSQFPAQLAHCLEIRRRFYITHGSADLGYDKIVLAGISQQFDISFYLVGDMGYDLYCFAQIISPALFVDHALVYAPRGYIVGTRCRSVHKPLVVS